MRRMRVICRLMLALFLVAPMGAAAGEIITVDDDGAADFNNIQAAIDDANDGDVVIVQPGTYTGHGNRDIDFLGKAITVRSTNPNDPNIVAATIIDCNGTFEDPHRGFRFYQDEDRNSILDGLTIRNGYADQGGAIGCYGAGPTIRNCIITSSLAGDGGGIFGCGGPIRKCTITANLATNSGGGLCYCSGPITDCNVSWNTADNGGAIHHPYAEQFSLTVVNCTMNNNHVTGLGGAVSWWGNHDANVTITNCTFVGNSAGYQAGAIFCDYGRTLVSECKLTRNSAAWYGGAISCQGRNKNFTKCIIANNSAKWFGGALYCSYSSSATLKNCTVTGNWAEHQGGAIFCIRATASITSCTISGNSAVAGGAITSESGNLSAVNCVVSSNLALSGAGVFCKDSGLTISNSSLSGNWAEHWGGGIDSRQSNCLVKNCIFWANRASEGPAVSLAFDSNACVSFSDIQGGADQMYVRYGSTLTWGPGNIDADPCFLLPGYWEPNGTPPDVNDDFWVDGDYHLLADSPCIDTGDPNYIAGPNETDLDGNPRIADGDNDGNSVVDMGAYEANYIEVAMRFTPQTLNPGSGGRWVKVHFVLPEEFGVEDVDANRPAVIWPVGVSSDWINVFVNEDELVEIEAAFGRAAFCAEVPAERTLDVMGILYGTSGQSFYGIDTVKITNHVFEYLSGLASYWLEDSCGQPDWCGGTDLDQDSVVDFADFVLFEGCCIEVVPE